MKARSRFSCRTAALLLGLSLLCGGCALADARLMVATDLHYLSPSLYEGSGLFLRSVAAGDGKMTQYSPQLLEALIQQALAEKPDALLLTGDLTYNGERQSHLELSQALQRVSDAGIPVLTIPGNHDINNTNAYLYQGEEYSMTDRETEGHYKQHYAPFWAEKALFRDESTYSYAYPITGSLWCVMLDLSVYIEDVISSGYITPETLDWLRGVLEAAKAAGADVITATHQSLLSQNPILRSGYGIYEGEALAALLREYGVTLNLSGHVHILHHTTQDGLTDAATSALSVSPHRYAMLTLGDDHTFTYEALPLSASYLPEGFAQTSAAAFLTNSTTKAANSLAKVELSDSDRAALTAFAAQVNQAYFAGTVFQQIKEWRASNVYALWQEKAAQSTWAAYVESMLDSGEEDMTRFEGTY